MTQANESSGRHSGHDHFRDEDWLDFSVPRPPKLGEKIAAGATLVFDSFRQAGRAGMRGSSGAMGRQLLYKAGRYTIKLQVEPGIGKERPSIVGQILDEQDPTGGLRDIAVVALKGSKTLDRTITNQLGEFRLEPGATGRLQLSVDVPEIGTFTVESPRAKGRRDAEGKAIEGSGRGRKARPR